MEPKKITRKFFVSIKKKKKGTCHQADFAVPASKH